VPPTDEYGQYPDFLLKFGKILSTNEMREVDEFVASMKWGQEGAIVPVDSSMDVEVIYDDNIKYLTLRGPETHGVRNIDLVFSDEEITNIMDGTGRIVRQIRHSAMEQEKLYHESTEALKVFRGDSEFGLDNLQDPEPLQFEAPEFDSVGGKKPTRGRRSYVLYETADSIAEKWNDESLIGYCEYCGMADSPIVIPRKDNSDTKAKCKWCAELDNLTWHIKYNGGVGYSADKEPWKMPDLLSFNWLRIGFIALTLWTTVIMLLQMLGFSESNPTIVLLLATFSGALGVIYGQRHGGSVD